MPKKLETSRVFLNPNGVQTGIVYTNTDATRTSKETWLMDHEHSDFVYMKNLISAVTGLSMESAEAAQVILNL